MRKSKSNKLSITVSLLITLLGVHHKVSAQQNAPQPAPTPNAKSAEPTQLELNTMLMRSTFALVGENSIGTAFIVGKPSTKSPGQAYFVLVTAAHVLEQMKSDVAVLIARQNVSSQYKKLFVPIKIREGGRLLWVRHPEADVAVMYVSLPKEIDIALLPTGFLATDETLNEFEVHPGDNLLCLGYPNGVTSNDEGFPILRSGRIASFPILPTKKVKSFLFDFNVFDGNSGGPVYFVESARTYKGATNAGIVQFIVGVVSEQVFAPAAEVTSGSRPKESMRLAIVIHASLIKEAIDLLPSLDK